MIRRTPIETRIHHERWLVSYSDFITLLFAFFVVMYSVSQVNESKYRVLAESFGATFSGSGSGAEPQDELLAEGDSNNLELADMPSLTQDLVNVMSELLGEGAMYVSGNEEWVEIELNANVLFRVGQADISPEAQEVLIAVADVLAPYDNAVAVAGHTDDMPISNQQFANNWALSSARAVSVVNLLALYGVNPQRLSAEGYGEYRPVVPNDSAAGRSRNRRVVLKLAKHAVPPPTENIDSFVQAPVAIKQVPSLAQESLNAEGQEAPPASPSPQSGQVQPVRLQSGGLLFSRDPDLPRTNPPISATPEPR